jgi:hypothetical protein
MLPAVCTLPQIMLLSDGSVTRHLQLMTDQRVEVECLEMRNIGLGREGLPPETALIPGPLVQRQVCAGRKCHVMGACLCLCGWLPFMLAGGAVRWVTGVGRLGVSWGGGVLMVQGAGSRM